MNFIGHTLDELEVVDGWLRCELLNRHDTHTQTLMPMSGDAIVVVAPAAVDFSEAGHFDTVRAFTLARHTCVHLHRGTWHWGPYPLDAPSLRIFNVQGRGYAADNGIAWLTREERAPVVKPPVEVLPMVTLTGQQMRGIFLVTVLLMPGLIAFAGGAMWWWRR